MSSKFDVVVLGLKSQGLFLLREFSRAGLNVLAVGLKGNVGITSKYGVKRIIESFDELDSIFAMHVGEMTEIHITSDPFLNYLVGRNHNIFQQNCFPNYKGASVFTDKIKTADLARRLHIHALLTSRLNEYRLESVSMFPLIVKWNRQLGGEKFKTMVVESRDNLEMLKKQHADNSELIVQRYIPGGPDADVSFGGYFVNGVEKLGITVKQKRQFPTGISSFVGEYSGKYADDIRLYCKRLMAETDYSGFVEVECRIDRKEKKVYLIEVNPRACGWIKIIKKKYGSNWLRRISGSNDLAPRDRVCWVNIARDVRAIIDILKKEPQKFDRNEIVFDYLQYPIMDILELKDIMPFIMQLVKVFKKDH